MTWSIMPSVCRAAQALTTAGAPGSPKSSVPQSTPRSAAAAAKAGTSRYSGSSQSACASASRIAGSSTTSSRASSPRTVSSASRVSPAHPCRKVASARCTLSGENATGPGPSCSSSRRPKPVTEDVATGTSLQVAPQLLLALDRLEQRLEVALAEAAGAVALDDLEEHRRAVADGLGEDLQHVALVVAVDEDAEPPQVLQRLLDLADARGHVVVVGLGHVEELDPALAHLADRLDDVARRHRDVLRAGAAVELEVLVDLRLALALGRLVDRELDPPVAARDDLGHQRG